MFQSYYGSDTKGYIGLCFYFFFLPWSRVIVLSDTRWVDLEIRKLFSKLTVRPSLSFLVLTPPPPTTTQPPAPPQLLLLLLLSLSLAVQ